MALKDSSSNKIIATYGQKFRCVHVYADEDEYYRVGTIIECIGPNRFTNDTGENSWSHIKFSDSLSGVNGRWEPLVETFTEKLEDYM